MRDNTIINGFDGVQKQLNSIEGKLQNLQKLIALSDFRTSSLVDLMVQKNLFTMADLEATTKVLWEKYQKDYLAQVEVAKQMAEKKEPVAQESK